MAEPYAPSRSALETFKVKVFESAASLFTAASVDVVVFAVKPQDMKSVLSSLYQHLMNPVVLSIAAGISTGSIKQWIGAAHGAVVRCMPNTPALKNQVASFIIGC